MQVTEQRIQIDASWFSIDRDVERSKGLHLGHVIDFIEHQERMADKPKVRGAGGQNYMAAGFMWERVLNHLVNDDKKELWEWLFGRVLSEPDNPKIIRPGELCLDGIYLTPDAVHLDDHVLEEHKYTTKKPAPLTDPKFRRWSSWQIPSYLKALKLHTCRLRVFFARGDYEGDPTPVWMEYLITYSQQEIDETWEAVIQNAATMRTLGLV